MGSANPMPCASHQSTTPSAARSPNRLDPHSTTAWQASFGVAGPRIVDSRVPGAPPRAAIPPTVPAGGRTTVHPV